MSSQYVAFVLVTLAAALVLVIGKPVFTRFMSVEDFNRRRNLWLLLTAASFLAPNIWLYLLVAAPAVLYGARKDPNPVALYLFLVLAVPPIRIQIPTLGLVGQIFPMDHLRLLSLALMLPVALRLGSTRHATPDPSSAATRGLKVADILLLSFLAWQVVLMLPHEPMTASMRRIALMLIDVVLPYFVISRACRSREMIVEAMAAFVMAAVILTPLAVFEFFKGWMLFAGIQDQWGAGRMYFPLHRGVFLRAQTTAGHSINYGYYMAMAFGMWLYLQGRIQARGWQWLGFATLVAGLIVALARGPWVGAALILFAYLALGPNPTTRLLKGLLITGVLAGAALLSPLGPQIIDHLPFIGTVDAQTIEQRQQLAAGSWALIQLNPAFGSPYFMEYMEEFRTGEGIIDLVNTYATIALSFGLVGMGLFAGVFVALLWQAHRVVRELASADPDYSLVGASLIACIIGTLAVIATTSFQLALPAVAWGIAALTQAYVRLAVRVPAYSEPVPSTAWR